MFVLLRLKGDHVINKGREVLFYKSIVMSKVSFIQIYEVIFYGKMCLHQKKKITIKVVRFFLHFVSKVI